MKETTVLKAFKRDYHINGARPYRNRLHDVDTDAGIDWREEVYRALDDYDEGEIIEIVIRSTGWRSPLAGDPWVLLSPHTYGPRSQVSD